jgi:hypothetical protein
MLLHIVCPNVPKRTVFQSRRDPSIYSTSIWGNSWGNSWDNLGLGDMSQTMSHQNATGGAQ